MAVVAALPAMAQAEDNKTENTTSVFQFNQVVVTATKTEMTFPRPGLLCR